MYSRKCFFIDDDEDDRNFFCTAIGQINSSIECVFAKDGHNAIEQLNSDVLFIPDFIFIDMNMPMMNGSECLAIIKSIDRLQNVPVYIYSTTASSRLIEEVMAAGARDFLVKPSSMAEMITTLRRIVSTESANHDKFLPDDEKLIA